MHGMHLKRYDSRAWTTECILRPTIRGFSLGIHLKAHYARLGGPPKASTFKVTKIKNLDIGPRGWDFQISPFGRRGRTPRPPFSDDGLQNLRAVGLTMDKMRIVALKIFSHL